MGYCFTLYGFNDTEIVDRPTEEQEQHSTTIYYDRRRRRLYKESEKTTKPNGFELAGSYSFGTLDKFFYQVHLLLEDSGTVYTFSYEAERQIYNASSCKFVLTCLQQAQVFYEGLSEEEQQEYFYRKDGDRETFLHWFNDMIKAFEQGAQNGCVLSNFSP